jgi:quercetin dioxygenase-like cupin family protein
MHRRQFLELSALAAIAAPAKEVKAMHSANSPQLLSPIIVKPEEAQVYNMLAGEAHLLVTGEQSNGAFFMGRFREDPGFMTHYHYHPNTDEQFYIIDGTLSVYVDDQWHDLLPGTLAVLPKGKPHAQGNRSDKPVHFIGSGAPAGFEKFFPAVDALMKRQKPGTPEFFAEFQKLFATCDIVSLGPAPK